MSLLLREFHSLAQTSTTPYLCFQVFLRTYSWTTTASGEISVCSFDSWGRALEYLLQVAYVK